MDGNLTMFDITVEVRDGGLNRLGQILPEDLNLTLTGRFNNVGEWKLALPIGHPLVPALRTPGAGIIVTIASGPLTGQTLFSGPMVSPEVTTSASDPGTVTLAGAADDILLADRLAHPAPTTLDPADAAQDVRTGTAEALMRAYVSANLGPAANVSRKDTRVAVPTGLGRGATSTQRPRFAVLGSLLASIAAGADYPTIRAAYHPGHLGFRLVQVGSTLEFQVYTVADRAAEIRLDVENGTLASHKVTTAAPTVTNVIVAGEGEGVDRTIVDRTTAEATAASVAWRRRIELLKDQRQTGDESELEQAGDAELAEGGLSQYAMEVVPGDDTAWEFGEDWNLGDIVSVVVRDGGDNALAASEYATVVTGYVLKSDSSGTRMGAVLGNPGENDLTKIERRISNLEANAEAASGYTVPDDFIVGDGDAKRIRLRTTGADLGIGASAAPLTISTWTGADFTGTQYPKLILPLDAGVLQLPAGASSDVAATADAHLIRRDYLESRLSVGSVTTVVGQWYRVATFGSGATSIYAARTAAEVQIAWTASGHHGIMRFDVGIQHMSPNNATLNMVEHSGYNTLPDFVQARLVYQNAGAYAGAHLEIKCNQVFTTNDIEIRIHHRDTPIGVRLTPVWTTAAATPTSPAFVNATRGTGYTGEFVSPTLTNSWAAYGTPYEVPGYRMGANNMVELRGLMKNAVAGASDAFTLPLGYRPTLQRLFTTIGGGGIARYDIYPTGIVRPSLGTSNGYFALDGITFLAEQ